MTYNVFGGTLNLAQSVSHTHTHAHTHTCTHTQPFNGLFSRTSWVGRYQKDKPFWILLKQNDGVAVASAGPYAHHLHLAPDI